MPISYEICKESPKVTSVLRQKGKQISQKTVARIMKEQGLQ
ncbi:IS3 family transposase, partial [Bacillus thuringiensis]